jgi:hypothetical protein
VRGLIGQIEKFRDASSSEKQSDFVNVARFLIVATGVGTSFLHLKNVQVESSISLATAGVMGLLN